MLTVLQFAKIQYAAVHLRQLSQGRGLYHHRAGASDLCCGKTGLRRAINMQSYQVRDTSCTSSCQELALFGLRLGNGATCTVACIVSKLYPCVVTPAGLDHEGIIKGVSAVACAGLRITQSELSKKLRIWIRSDSQTRRQFCRLQSAVLEGRSCRSVIPAKVILACPVGPAACSCRDYVEL